MTLTVTEVICRMNDVNNTILMWWRMWHVHGIAVERERTKEGCVSAACAFRQQFKTHVRVTLLDGLALVVSAEKMKKKFFQKKNISSKT